MSYEHFFRRGDDLRKTIDPVLLTFDRGGKKWWARFDALVSQFHNGSQDRDAVLKQLFMYASLPPVLFSAWHRLERQGGDSPGPDGIRYGDLTGPARWDACRQLSDLIRNGTYRPGDERTVHVPKVGKRGTRPIRLQGVLDRVVQRSVASVVGPIVDPTFDARSFGFRPGLDRRHALAEAESLAVGGDRTVWVLADLKDAFESVPVGRLIDVVRFKLRNDELIDLISKCVTRVENGTTLKRGLRQGGPLSPLMMNMYLDHFLDRHWRAEFADTPLVRYADDIAILCKSRAEAESSLALLRNMLTPTGMVLKDADPEGCVFDLGESEADWLGFRVGLEGGSLAARLSDRTWASLASKLEMAHEKPNSSLVARDVVRGWIDQLGPCYKHSHFGETYKRLASVCAEAGFDEVQGRDEVKDIWKRSFSRWRQLRERDSFTYSQKHSEKCSW